MILLDYDIVMDKDYYFQKIVNIRLVTVRIIQKIMLNESSVLVKIYLTETCAVLNCQRFVVCMRYSLNDYWSFYRTDVTGIQ